MYVHVYFIDCVTLWNKGKEQVAILEGFMHVEFGQASIICV